MAASASSLQRTIRTQGPAYPSQVGLVSDDAIDDLGHAVLACVRAAPGRLTAQDIYRKCADYCETRLEIARSLSKLVRQGFLVVSPSQKERRYFPAGYIGMDDSESGVSIDSSSQCLQRESRQAIGNPPHRDGASIDIHGLTTDVALPPLMPQQEEAVTAAVESLSSMNRSQIIMACGTGKTRVGPEVAIRLGARMIVVYLPSLALVRQTLPYWKAAAFPGGISYLCVCSDETVDQFEEDALVVTGAQLRRELGGSAVTTSAQTVRRFLLEGCSTQDHRTFVVFSTYQSCDVVASGCPENFAFDLGVFEEAHRTAGREGPFNIPLNDSGTLIRKRLFMTATPKHLTGSCKRIGAYSMDDEAAYGSIAYSLSMRQAIQRGMISDYRVVVCTVDDETISREISLNGVDLDKGDKASLAHAIAIRKAMEKFGLSKVLTFHESVRSAMRFSLAPGIRGELGIPAMHVNGAMLTRKRSEVMNAFASSPTALVTNARCLTEGVDVPAMDMVAFLSPRKSKLDIVQAIGRVLRRHEGKTHGYVLLPIYISKVDPHSIQSAMLDSSYDGVWSVLQALCDNDESVASSLREKTRQQASSNGSRHLDLDFVEFIGPDEHLAVLRRAISAHCVEVLSEPWDSMCAVLEQFVKRNGHPDVPCKHVTEDGLRLGGWCSTQRRDYRSGRLSKEKIAALEAIGFKWHVHDAAFERNFDLLKKFKKRHGHVLVPRNHKTDEGAALGLWCVSRRREYREGILAEERVAALEALGFEWNVLKAQFEENFRLLCAFKNEFGHVDISRNYVTADGVSLGVWSHKLRNDHKVGRLSHDRVKRLEKLGFKWSVLESSFAKHLRLLVEFKARNGHANVPKSYVTSDGVELGRWCRNRRRDYRLKISGLTPERVKAMEDLGFQWVRSTIEGRGADRAVSSERV